MRRPWSALGRSRTKKNAYRTTVLSLVSYGCDTWSMMLRGGHELKVFENRVLRKIFGPKRAVVPSDCGQLLNPLNPELNHICYLLALLAHHFLQLSRIRVKSLTLRLLMSYTHGAPILDVSRSHTTTQHSR